jgi:hypothetical protein
MTRPRILTGPEADAIRADPPTDPSLMEALLTGRVLHFPDMANHVNAAHLKQKGWRLRTRKAPGGGRYFWVDPISGREQT